MLGKATSPDMIIVAGCQSDEIMVPFIKMFHKESIGCLVVSIDMLSILIMAMFFSKLNDLNEEYIDILDGMTVQMKDFAVRINSITLDRYTNDPRILKIKLWDHFNEKVLKKDRSLENYQELLEININIYNQPSFQQILKMQDVQTEINSIQNNMSCGVYDNEEIHGKMNELKVLERKLQ